VATERHDDARLASPDDRDAPAGGAEQAEPGLQGAQAGLALQPAAGDLVEAVAGGRHHVGLDAAVGADEVDLVGRHPGLDEGGGDGQAGHEVAGGAPAGDEDAGHRGAVGRGWRAMFSSIPAPIIVTSSELPP
jgi:hypothetical protein